MTNTRGRSRGSHPKPSTNRSTPPTGRGGSSIVGRGREIANEWSPRGRCNNNSSGNGRDKPDECSPIGRGSNNSGNDRGRVDECSPRGRGSNNSGNVKGRADDYSPIEIGSNNTSGNGRSIANDCSPKGRGSNIIGGCGNESADEWCPSQDMLGDERLDVHEDNEEHMEHVVGSSQNQVESNVTPSSSLPKLWLVGGVFYDPAISRHAVRLFKTMFKGSYATWSKFPLDHRDRCFNRFGTFYRWEDAESNQIRDAWESHMKNRYSDIMRSVRKAAMKASRVNTNVDIGRISSNRPNWIGVNDWQPMVNVWDTDEWRLKSKIAKENRDKSQSGKHTAGSRSFLHTKIVMEKTKGRRVKLVELHTAVHTKKVTTKKVTEPGEPESSGIPEFVDPMSKQRLDEYLKIISEKHVENEGNTDIDENGSKSPPDDFEVWKGVGTSKRGHVLGAGFTKDPAFVLTGTVGSGSVYATHTCSPYEEIRILKKQNDDLRKKMEDAEAQRVADQVALHKTLNEFAKNYPPRATESDPGPS